MLKKTTFDKQELEIILESLERQSRYTKLWWSGDEKVPLDNLITQFKKAREEYEKIFFERYGAK